MAAWTGWASDLLQVLLVKETHSNLRFLNQWHTYAQTPCQNNPLSATHAWAGSSLCRDPVRRYKTRADGLQATAAQLHEAKYDAIMAALEHGDPYSYSRSFQVASALSAWGALGFAQDYQLETAQAPAGSHIAAGKTQKGWGSVQHSINRTLPRTLRRSSRLMRQALRDVKKAHKVKL